MPEQQQTLTIQQALDLAVQHHTAGRLPQAESIYNQILQGTSNNALMSSHLVSRHHPASGFQHPTVPDRLI